MQARTLPETLPLTDDARSSAILWTLGLASLTAAAFMALVEAESGVPLALLRRLARIIRDK